MNNNPLQILRSNTTFQGEMFPGGELKSFKSKAYGYRAGFAILFSLIGQPVSALANHFASEDKEAFIKKVCRLAKVKADDVITPNSYKAISIIHAIARIQNKEASLDEVNAGFRIQIYFV